MFLAFKTHCKITPAVAPNIWVESLSPNYTTFIDDSWCFDIPLVLKPTFINMDLDISNLRTVDIVIDNCWPISKLGLVF